MIEIERTYLITSLPKDVKESPKVKIRDKYIPHSHPRLRIRQKNDTYELTRKMSVKKGDHSQKKELTIPLEKNQFEALFKTEGHTVFKTRYLYQVGNYTAEIDVFEGKHKGLIIAEFEFDSKAEMKLFKKPEFCGADVTQEEFIRGGILCELSYEDITPLLKVILN